MRQFETLVAKAEAMATGTTVQTPRDKWLAAIAEADRIEAESVGLDDVYNDYLGVEIDPGRRETIAESVADAGGDPVLVKALLNPSAQAPEITLQDAVNIYLEERLSGPENEAGRVRLSRVFKRVKEALGDLSSIALVDLKRKDGRALRDFMLNSSRNGGGTLKPATVHRELNLVRAVVSMGIREFDLKGRAANPFEGLSVTPSNTAQTINDADMRDPLPPEVLDAMAERMKRGSNRNPEPGLVWRMLAGTGCPMAEVTGLRVQDVDLSRATSLTCASSGTLSDAPRPKLPSGLSPSSETPWKPPRTPLGCPVRVTSCSPDIPVRGARIRPLSPL